jgi:hypothetical protein
MGCCKLLRGKEEGYGRPRWTENGGLEDGFVAKAYGHQEVEGRRNGTGMDV